MELYFISLIQFFSIMYYYLKCHRYLKIESAISSFSCTLQYANQHVFFIFYHKNSLICILTVITLECGAWDSTNSKQNSNFGNQIILSNGTYEPMTLLHSRNFPPSTSHSDGPFCNYPHHKYKV